MIHQKLQHKKAVAILGIRGIPARHGGFETFAEKLALYLTSRGWEVTVYCQDDSGKEMFDEYWNSIHLVHIPVRCSGTLGTIIFDWKSTLQAAGKKDLILTLGYNTAIFCFVYRLKGLKNLINMDGIEWRRQKWNPLERTWLYLNEYMGCWLGDYLIADHPEILSHLATRVLPNKITMIPYGAAQVLKEKVNKVNALKLLDWQSQLEIVLNTDAKLLKLYNLVPNEYAILIARPEPENSILEIVSAFSSKSRGFKLVVLGCYQPNINNYHKKVVELASSEVLFIGAVYEGPVVNTLRLYARLYIHGHTVGGTNPSLVEAMGAGIPILAHNNIFNQWVAGTGAHYFRNEHECAWELDQLLNDKETLRKMKRASIARYCNQLSWEKILEQYESLLTRALQDKHTESKTSFQKLLLKALRSFTVGFGSPHGT